MAAKAAGYVKISWVVLSDPESIQKSGVPMTITARP